MRKIILSILGLLFVIASVFISKKWIDNKSRPKPIVPKIVKSVFVDTVYNINVPITIQGNGSLYASEKIELFSETQGILKKGTHQFKKGQNYNRENILLNIDNTEYLASVQSARSSLSSSIASIMPDLKIDFTENYSQWESYLVDYDIQKNISALPEIENEQEKYFITGKGILKEYYNVKALEKRLSKYKITAPFTGILTEALVTEGTLIRNGQKLGEYINPSIFEMEIAISKSYAHLLQIGKKVLLKTLDQSDSYHGIVKRINGSINVDTQTVAVFIEVNNTNNNLKEGLYLNTHISVKNIENAIEVDRNLLLDSNEIFIIKNNQLALIPAKPIHYSNSKVILQNIPNGTVILKTPISGSYVGMLVKPLKK